MRKVKLAVFVGLLLLLAYCMLKVLIYNVPFLIACASKDAVYYENGIIIGREKDNVIVSYTTENGNYSAKIDKSISNRIFKKGEKISIYYDKKNNAKVYEPGGSWYLMGVLFLFPVIFYTVFFYDIFSKIKTKKWTKAEYDYVSTSQIAFYCFKVVLSHDQDGQKKMNSCFITSNMIEASINGGMIDKVPVRINPKNSKEVRIDFEELDKKIKVFKQFV